MKTAIRFVCPVLLAAAVVLIGSCQQEEKVVEKIDPRYRVAVLVTEGFHDGEAFMPIGYLTNLGARVTVIGPRTGTVKAYNSDFTIRIEKAVAEVTVDDFDALVIPGGRAPAKLREDDAVVAFVRDFFETGRPTAAICHGPQVLVTAGVLEGKTATAFGGIREELEAAGVNFLDQSVVIYENLITSRVPPDLGDFCAAIAAWMRD